MGFVAERVRHPRKGNVVRVLKDAVADVAGRPEAVRRHRHHLPQGMHAHEGVMTVVKLPPF